MCVLVILFHAQRLLVSCHGCGGAICAELRRTVEFKHIIRRIERNKIGSVKVMANELRVLAGVMMNASVFSTVLLSSLSVTLFAKANLWNVVTT